MHSLLRKNLRSIFRIYQKQLDVVLELSLNYLTIRVFRSNFFSIHLMA